MTNISVIKMIISVAVWRIYPSWVNDKLRAWEGLGHSVMFWARLSRDDFRLKLENISFLSRVMSVSKSFLFPAILKNLAPSVQALELWFRWCLGGLFENSAPSPGMFLRPPTTTTSIFWEFPFFFPKQSRCYLPDSYGDPQAEQSTLDGDGALKTTRMKLDLRALARSSAEGPSIVVAIGNSRVLWSMVQKRKKHKEVSVWLCEGSTLHHVQTSEFWGACFRDPMSLPFSHFAVFVVVDVQLQDDQAAARGKAKKSSHPCHFRCWSLRRNELECTDLVYWTGALHRFSSRDAIIVVGSVLEKHFDGDFTPDQEKEITFKRWPPGYQSWKLGLALNGSRRSFKASMCHSFLYIAPGDHSMRNSSMNGFPPYYYITSSGTPATWALWSQDRDWAANVAGTSWDLQSSLEERRLGRRCQRLCQETCYSNARLQRWVCVWATAVSLCVGYSGEFVRGLQRWVCVWATAVSLCVGYSGEFVCGLQRWVCVWATAVSLCVGYSGELCKPFHLCLQSDAKKENFEWERKGKGRKEERRVRVTKAFQTVRLRHCVTCVLVWFYHRALARAWSI